MRKVIVAVIMLAVVAAGTMAKDYPFDNGEKLPINEVRVGK